MHTKGPWIIIHNHAWDKYIDVRTKSGKQIAFVGSLNESDAKLIAAAPDLLEALKGVVRVADRATDEFDAARAAIAKAEGGGL